MNREVRIVNNRVFLLGLDALYREAMKRHEKNELLGCAREVASQLSLVAAEVSIEGYYSEDEQLTEYFRLMRALQAAPRLREHELATVHGFTRLKQVTESPIFGQPRDGPTLLRRAVDPLYLALQQTFPDWSVSNLVRTAYECARDSTDYSLVALAALSQDPVVLAALRESVVLYAAVMAGSAMRKEPEYHWNVDDLITARANQFVQTFNDLFQEQLPKVGPENAAVFWGACREWELDGRCVRIGFDDREPVVRHYHWAIDRGRDGQLTVSEFWETEIWTTARYRETHTLKP